MEVWITHYSYIVNTKWLLCKFSYWCTITGVLNQYFATSNYDSCCNWLSHVTGSFKHYRQWPTSVATRGLRSSEVWVNLDQERIVPDRRAIGFSVLFDTFRTPCFTCLSTFAWSRSPRWGRCVLGVRRMPATAENSTQTWRSALWSHACRKLTSFPGYCSNASPGSNHDIDSSCQIPTILQTLWLLRRIYAFSICYTVIIRSNVTEDFVVILTECGLDVKRERGVFPDATIHKLCWDP